VVSQRSLIQAGAVAAALASIIGVAFTVGDRVTGLFGSSESTPRVTIDDVALEKMSLKQYLQTDVHPTPVPLPYTAKARARTVLVMDLRARYVHAARGGIFPATLVLERRTSGGAATVIPHQMDYYLDTNDDQCECHDWFPLPAKPGEYRIRAQIFRPNGGSSEPLDERASDWMRL
jgi:hypothetical protein